MDQISFEKRKKVINDLIHDKFYVPMKAKEIAILLNIPKENRADLMKVLDSLVAEGKIGVTTKGKYTKYETSTMTGVFTSSQKGFGFVTVEGEPEDIYIPENQINGAFHNDTVTVRITREAVGDKRREGAVVKVLERGYTRVVGTYEPNGNYGFVVPDNQRFMRDIYIAKGDNNGAMHGHKVVVIINDYGDEKHNPSGYVEEIIGHINDPGADIMSVVAGLDIPSEFPEEVMEYVAAIPDHVEPTEYEGRKDMRHLQTVTIDGEDAKDLDDAISIARTDKGYTLCVHIADVSEYVKENSVLDKEALERGTSVYLVDRVIPMLPHKLSNGICSLNQGEDRLAMSCIMQYDHKGNQIGHEICESIINVDRRMSYTAVKKILEDKDQEMMAEYSDFVDMFELMGELSLILREKRHKRGSIDFDFPESKITLNEKGTPVEIKAYERNVATKIIEDFMLAANETVAEDFYWQGNPFLYRTHEKPDPKKIMELCTFINNFGYSIHVGNEEVHPKELQKLLENISGSEEEALLSRLTLRSMKRAQYSTECSGHFGLAAQFYTHFTSPIRRYPDLQIHRIIKENLRGKLSASRVHHYESILPDVAKHTSMTERRADDAERDVEKMKKTEYMARHVGEIFDGVISGVTAWGIYVELPNTIEGMVHVTTIDGDYYVFDEHRYELFGEKTHITYRLGQRVRVKCISADKTLRNIDFKLVNQRV